MRYRIIKEVEKNGKELFYVQRPFLFYFWAYVSEIRDISMRKFRIAFNSLSDAENFIQKDVDIRYKRSQERVVSSEVVKEWA